MVQKGSYKISYVDKIELKYTLWVFIVFKIRQLDLFFYLAPIQICSRKKDFDKIASIPYELESSWLFNWLFWWPNQPLFPNSFYFCLCTEILNEFWQFLAKTIHGVVAHTIACLFACICFIYSKFSLLLYKSAYVVLENKKLNYRKRKIINNILRFMIPFREG